jgi:hypothetical protein
MGNYGLVEGRAGSIACAIKGGAERVMKRKLVERQSKTSIEWAVNIVTV